MARKPKNDSVPTLTTAQRLGSLLKSARDIMRKDKGLNGDLDRLPMLTWVMFLKFLDDLELQREQEAALAGERFRPAVDAPYRWRDWAGNPQGPTGDDLLAFINGEKVTRPDGTEGPGLFAYLRGLTATNGDDRREVIATVFRAVDNRMRSGYLLRDVLDRMSEIHFTSSEELHTLGAMYESMLREMRDAAGDSGEFYTPRAVVRFMVQALDPRLGETVLDPAAGTGGFLVEAFSHLSSQVRTVQDREVLQRRSLFGCEPKGLPYLLGQMNLLLHGLDAPQIDPGNALRFKLSEIGDAERVDVILTNPPFGGAEEKGIQDNFPSDRQTAETALLFLQLIMRKLNRNKTSAGRHSRAAVVVPNGTLYEEGAAQLIRQDLIEKFNLRFVVRLPKGVFEPYTDISTNILFFDNSGTSKDIWFYEHPLPAHRAHLKGKSYSATDGIQFQELESVIKWMTSPTENEHAWRMSVAHLAEENFDLSQTHPKKKQIAPLKPQNKLSKIHGLWGSIKKKMEELDSLINSMHHEPAPLTPLMGILHQREDSTRLNDDVMYVRPRIQLHFRGARVRDKVFGRDIGTKNQTFMRTNDLVVSRIDARNGAMAIVPTELDGAIATNDFPIFELDTSRIIPTYLRYCLFQPYMVQKYEAMSRGSTNRRRLNVQKFLNLTIPIPSSLDFQLEIADSLMKSEVVIGELKEHFGGMDEEMSDMVGSILHHLFDFSSLSQ